MTGAEFATPVPRGQKPPMHSIARPRGLRHPAALAYMAIALPIALVLVFAVPPFQNPDEGNHFARAIQLSHGQLVGRRVAADSAGGVVDPDAVWLIRLFEPLRFHPERKLNPLDMAKARTAAWGGVPHYAEFGNSVVNPPVFYAAAVAAIWAVRAAGGSMLDGMYAARLACALGSILLAGLAIGLAARARSLVFLVLSLPMTLTLFAGCTQDGLLIASVALCASVFGEAREGEARTGWRMLAASVLLGAVGAARSPYLLLAAVPGLLRAPRWRAAVLVVLPPIAIGVLWLVAGVLPVRNDFRPAQGVDAAAQLAGVLAHPWHFIRAVGGTIWSDCYAYYLSTVGVFGWLDTLLPRAYYDAAWVPFAAAAAAECWGKPREHRTGGRLLLLGVLAATALGLMLAMYLIWTPVGSDRVDGITGRYLIPLLLFVPLLFRRGGLLPTMPGGLRGGAWVAVCACAAAGWWYVPMTIILRYYD